MEHSLLTKHYFFNLYYVLSFTVIKLFGIVFPGPPKLVVTPTKLMLLDPFHRSLIQSNGDATRPPHYTKTRAPAISSQSKPTNGHLSLMVAPTWSEATAQPQRRMGVASLLFHRPLSPKDVLQVHNYTQDALKIPQLEVHSYAKEHKPRHLQNKITVESHGTVEEQKNITSLFEDELEPAEIAHISEQDQKDNSISQSAEEHMSKSEEESVGRTPSCETSPVKVDKNKRKVCRVLEYSTLTQIYVCVHNYTILS